MKPAEYVKRFKDVAGGDFFEAVMDNGQRVLLSRDGAMELMRALANGITRTLASRVRKSTKRKAVRRKA